MHFHRASTPADIRRELEQFYRAFAQSMPRVGNISPSPCTQTSVSSVEPGEGGGGGSSSSALTTAKRLRIGYLCSEFRGHVLGRFILPLIVHHDRTQFEIFCYADSTADDETTKLFRRFAEHWTPVAGQTDGEIAEKIASDRLDILFDLQLHMARNRLLVFARKPAPIQATYCGYPGSTGLPTVDFRITDPVLDPPGVLNESTVLDDLGTLQTQGAQNKRGMRSKPGASSEPTIETPIRLPHAYWCYDPDAIGYIAPNQSLWNDLPVNNLPALTNRFLTFGCLNNFCKIDSQMLALWAAALHAAPGSQLVMMAPPGSARQWVLATLKTYGIDAARIRFVGRQARIDYFRTYHAIDVALDTLPANGHTTSLDALWMGVPVITRVGETAMGRATWSQLLQLGLTGLAADSDAQFAEIAGQLAADLPALAILRRELRDRMRASPLTDSRQFTRDFEDLCRRMHEQSPIRGEP
jgi:protein O-GlcNAc transferase